MTHINFPSWPHISPESPYRPKIETPDFSPKKAGKNAAHVVFILDDSASMQSCRTQTIKGFNEFLKGHKESDVKTFVSLYKFNGLRVDTVLEHVDVSTVEPLNTSNYDPRGSTNLLDAIGVVMYKVNARLSRDKKKNRDSVQIVVLTDGQENSSSKFDNSGIKSMVEKAEGKEWTFMFLGANIDAFAVGGAMGFGHHNTLQYSTNSMEDTFTAATRMSNDLKVSKLSGVDNVTAYSTSTYTDEERKNAGE